MVKFYENEVKRDEPIGYTAPFENNTQVLTGGNRLANVGFTVAPSDSRVLVPLMRTYIAGEALLANQAVYVEDVSATRIQIDISGSTGTTEFFGNTNSGSRQKIAQSIQETKDTPIESFVVKLAKTGTPVDSAQITIEGDSGGNPDGIAAATFTKAAADLSGVLTEFTFTTSFVFRANTKYWIVLYRTGAESNTNHYQADVGSGSYSGGSERVLSGDIWSVGTGDDIYGKYQIATVANRIYKASASTAGEANAFAGFTQKYAAFLALTQIFLSGEVSGFSPSSTELSTGV